MIFKKFYFDALRKSLFSPASVDKSGMSFPRVTEWDSGFYSRTHQGYLGSMGYIVGFQMGLLLQSTYTIDLTQKYKSPISPSHMKYKQRKQKRHPGRERGGKWHLTKWGIVPSELSSQLYHLSILSLKPTAAFTHSFFGKPLYSRWILGFKTPFKMANWHTSQEGLGASCLHQPLHIC